MVEPQTHALLGGIATRRSLWTFTGAARAFRLPKLQVGRGAGFWRLLILVEGPVVELRRGAGGAVVADANVAAATAL